MKGLFGVLILLLAAGSLFYIGERLSLVALLGVLGLIFFMGVRVVRPTEKGLVERLGKYKRFSDQGFHVIIPVLERMIKVNITEQIEDVESQEIITQDRLNATIDAQVYYKVKLDETSVKSSQYNVNDYKYQIVSLAKTTLRNIIGNMSYQDANSKRIEINTKLQTLLTKEAKPWGLEIVRTEIKEIRPPKDVQDSMNNLIKAENTKKAALDLATAAETEGDGKKRANIKSAEGEKRSQILIAEGKRQATILEAEGQSKAIETVNTAIQKYFKGEAVTFKKLETAATALKRGTKIIVPAKASLVNVVSEAAGVAPIPMSGKTGK
jgi:regulator of protease activity HflC (stomatin/prohibitin superfamily)